LPPGEVEIKIKLIEEVRPMGDWRLFLAIWPIGINGDDGFAKFQTCGDLIMKPSISSSLGEGLCFSGEYEIRSEKLSASSELPEVRELQVSDLLRIQSELSEGALQVFVSALGGTD
jgi:hypothetical protein